ncbi:hypothetical protein [Alicyclobacillus shizuokensis]|uniref:hypothetical protein n=1 Tax=Alicyclobacillus shizuokensis TaxID=392014 RepID=UPI00082F6D8B|nr:hypothetical protein [Alicyclobacillus shizuokensis]MCL6625831.1 hypothetical protein [Alicyclobacillus shizuokensis]
MQHLGMQTRSVARRLFTHSQGHLTRILACLAWSLFVNLVDEWLVRPLVQDLAVIGVLVVLLMVWLWVFAIPRQRRRWWLVFSLFSLCACQALASFASLPLGRRLLTTAISMAILAAAARCIGRVALSLLLGSMVVLAAANAWLPENLWPLLTHFRVLAAGTLTVDNGNYPVLPLDVVKTEHGEVVLTVTEWPDARFGSSAAAYRQAVKSGKLPADHLVYQYVQLAPENGRIDVRPATAQELAEVQPTELGGAFTPFDRSTWAVVGGRLLQYTIRTQSSAGAVDVALQLAQYAPELAQLTVQANQDEWKDWSESLRKAGAAPVVPWRIDNGVLSGKWRGRTVHVRVEAQFVISSGSFTRPGAHELLLGGSNLLQVVSLSGSRPHVVASLHGALANPIGEAMQVGPIGTADKDVVFVNASPAYILSFTRDGHARRIYTAPNDDLQFLASIRTAPGTAPEILADDRSAVCSSSTTYLTSYTYRDGQLYRNWRVFESGIENVRQVQFFPEKPPYLVAAVAGSGAYVVLARHFWPLQPALVVAWLLVLAGFIVAGWRQRRRLRW